MVSKKHTNLFIELQDAINILYQSNDSEKLLDAYTAIISFKYELPAFSDEYKDTIITDINDISKTNTWQELTKLSNIKRIQSFENYRKIRPYLLNLLTEQKKIIKLLTPKFQMSNQNYQSYLENDIYLLLQDYYLQNDFSSLEILNDCIQNECIFNTSLNNCVGKSVVSNALKNPYLGLKSTNNLDMMLTIVHEVAHIKEFLQIKETESYKTLNDYIYQRDYNEVTAKKAEFDFLTYLLEHGYCEADVKNMLVSKLLYSQSLINNISSTECECSTLLELQQTLSKLRDYYGNTLVSFYEPDSSDIFIRCELLDDIAHDEEKVVESVIPLKVISKVIK